MKDWQQYWICNIEKTTPGHFHKNFPKCTCFSFCPTFSSPLSSCYTGLLSSSITNLSPFFRFPCMGSSQTYQCSPVSSRLTLCLLAFATGTVLHLVSQQMLCCISGLYCIHLRADERRSITNQSVSYHAGMPNLLNCWRCAQATENLLMTSPHRYLRAAWEQKRREERT